MRQYKVTLGNIMEEGVLLAFGNTTGARFGFDEF